MDNVLPLNDNGPELIGSIKKKDSEISIDFYIMKNDSSILDDEIQYIFKVNYLWKLGT